MSVENTKWASLFFWRRGDTNNISHPLEHDTVFPNTNKTKQEGSAKKVNLPKACSTMVLLLVIDPLLGNYLAHLGAHHWQNNFMFGNAYFSVLDDRFWWKSKIIKDKTTCSQRRINWSFYVNRYKTAIQKTHSHYKNQELPVICTRSRNPGVAFNQQSYKCFCCIFAWRVQLI